jgi:trafficking protein particle complex subunit 6
VLSDLKFKWLDRYVAGDSTSRRAASNMLHFPCGIVRGALANLGITSIVNADVNDFPACSFSIRVKPA